MRQSFYSVGNDFSNEALQEHTTGSPFGDSIGSSEGLVAGGAVTLTSDEYSFGFRFPNIDIPAGATIDRAFVTIRCNDVTGADGEHTFDIYGDDVAHSSLFIDEAGKRVIDRTQTTATTSWNETWTVGDSFTSPNLRDIIQEIIDVSGWKSGNAISLLFLWDDTGVVDNRYITLYGTGQNVVDGAISKPVLEIVYTYSGQSVKSKRGERYEATKFKKVSPSGIGMKSTTTAETSTNPSPGQIANGTRAFFTSTLASALDLKLFAFCEIDVYEGESVDATKLISGGSAIDANDYKVDRWYGGSQSDGNNLKYIVEVVNNSGGATHLLFRTRWRYIVDEGGE